jgi:hypothetical protein
MDGTCRTYATEKKSMSPEKLRIGILRKLLCELDSSSSEHDLMKGSCGNNNKL